MFRAVSITILHTMAIWVVEFSNGGYIIRKIFCIRINILKGILLNFENWVNGEVSKCAKI